jgi:hypothetical protein
MFSVFFTVNPLEEDIQQKVTAKNAERQEYRKRHANLTWTGVHVQPEQEESTWGNPKKS